jgi:hypothetical protein
VEDQPLTGHPLQIVTAARFKPRISLLNYIIALSSLYHCIIYILSLYYLHYIIVLSTLYHSIIYINQYYLHYIIVLSTLYHSIIYTVSLYYIHYFIVLYPLYPIQQHFPFHIFNVLSIYILNTVDNVQHPCRSLFVTSKPPSLT